jgi:uncharacterized protein (DUF1015 family)
MAVVAPFRGVRYYLEKIAHLEEVVMPLYDLISADSGEIMPLKSTCFFPKIMTGLLINKQVSGEKLVLPE